MADLMATIVENLLTFSENDFIAMSQEEKAHWLEVLNKKDPDYLTSAEEEL